MWQFKKLSQVFLFFIILIALWLIPTTYAGIHFIDVKSAYFFNSFVRYSPFWQNFWAYLNSSKADWYYDLIILAFSLYYIFSKDGKTKKQKTLECLFLVIFAIVCFFAIHRGYVKYLTRPHRISPTGVLSDLFRLSKVITWTRVKDFSTHSFPSDHGYTIFMFILSCFFLRGKGLSLLAALLSIPFIIPRLITGAHWLTDFVLGAFPAALLILSILFYSPAFHRLHRAKK